MAVVGEPAGATTSARLRVARAKRTRVRAPLRKFERAETPARLDAPDHLSKEHGLLQTDVTALLANREREHCETGNSPTSSKYASAPVPPRTPTLGSYLDAMTVTVTY
jgi:hypothetical protein